MTDMNTSRVSSQSHKIHTCSVSSGQVGIVWDNQPLGDVPDTRLALQLGVSSVAVRKARLKRNIPQYFATRHVGTGVGERTDVEVAFTLGVSRRSVSRIRKALGLHGPQTTDWDKQPLGQVPDVLLAKKLGVDPGLVGIARRHRNIPRGDLQWLTPEKEPATYPEAVIDNFWHQKGLRHQFQVRLGRYIADWVLEGVLVVEFAGLIHHRVLGVRYWKKIVDKDRFYKSMGMNSIIVLPEDIKDYMSDTDPEYRWKSKGCLICSAPFSSTAKHHAKGLCARCYKRRDRNAQV